MQGAVKLVGKMKILILCVNYNSNERLIDYMVSVNESLRNAPSVSLTFVCSDNSKEPKALKLNEAMLFDYKIIVTHENLGYFGGIEFAVNNCCLDFDSFDYVIFSNVDVKLRNDFFSTLEKMLPIDSLGCIAPRIWSQKENRNRNPELLVRYSKKKLLLLKCLYKMPLFYSIYSKVFYPMKRKANELSSGNAVYAAHGSFFVFGKQSLPFIKNIHFPSFLFGEEIYVAEELEKLCLKTIYVDELVVFDVDHESTSKMNRSFYLKCHYESIEKLLELYYGRKS